jgi:hypothetical protein
VSYSPSHIYSSPIDRYAFNYASKWQQLDYLKRVREFAAGGPFCEIPSNPSDAIRHAQHHLGRDQGTELFFTGSTGAITQGGLTTVTIPKPFNINRPLRKIRIDLVQAQTTATGAYTATNVDAPASILQNARITGTHAQFGVLTPINISGRALWMKQLARRKQANNFYLTLGTTGENGFPVGNISGFTSFPSSASIGGRVRMTWRDGVVPAAAITVAGGGASLNPLQSPLAGATGPLQAAVNTFLFENRYTVDLAPSLGPWARTSKLPFSWRPEDWADTLQLVLTFGDGNALGPIALANVTNQNIQYNIYFVYDLLGKDYIGKVSPAVLIQGEQAVAVPTKGSNNFRLTALQKKKTVDIIMTSGQLRTGGTVGPNVAFTNFDDSALDVTQAIVDGKPIHNNLNNLAYKDHVNEVYDMQMPQGMFMVDFLTSQSPLSAYPGQNVAGGAAFELDTNAPDPGTLLATNYNIQMIQDWFVGDPKIG